MQEAAKIQKNIDLVDQAFMGVTGQHVKAHYGGVRLGIIRGVLEPGQAPVVQGRLAPAAVRPSNAEHQMPVKVQGSLVQKRPITPMSLMQSQPVVNTLPDWYQPGKITIEEDNGTDTLWNKNTTVEPIAWSQDEKSSPHVIDVLKEWNYDYGARDIPRRNKLVLATIELIPAFSVFGMDRFYLGQPVLAALKAFFFIICGYYNFQGGWSAFLGVLTSFWPLLDAYFVARNCIAERTEIDEFGMIALFDNSKTELQIAAAIGGLIYLSWSLHMLWCGRQLYLWYIRAPERNFDPELAEGGVDPANDPFLENVMNFQDKAIDLNADPFLTRLPPKGRAPAVDQPGGASGLQPTGFGGYPLRRDEVADYA